jgi:hypothetical protein
VSKTFGIVLLGGLLGSVLLSIGLILWVWTRSANSPQDIVNTTPVPTTKAAIQSPEMLGYTLVDARQEAGGAAGQSNRSEFSLNATGSNGYTYISAGLESLAAACV